ANASLFTDLSAQVVEAGLAHVSVAEDLDLVDPGRVDQERPLHAHAVGDPADGEVAAQPAAGDADDRALEDLNALSGPFHHFGVDLDGVARPQLGHGLLGLLLLERLDHVHLMSPCWILYAPRAAAGLPGGASRGSWRGCR